MTDRPDPPPGPASPADAPKDRDPKDEDRPGVEEIATAVLTALRAWDAARTAPSRKPRWRTWPAAVAGFVMAHWVLLAFLGSAVLLLIAGSPPSVPADPVA